MKLLTSKDDLMNKLKELSPRRKEILSELLQGKSDKSIQEKFGTSATTVRKHVQEICDYFDIPTEAGRRRNRRNDLRQLFAQHSIVIETSSNTITEVAIKAKPATPPEEDYPGNPKQPYFYLSGIVPINSPLYVRRKFVDDFCEQQLEMVTLEAESLPLIKIKGARMMGKSSLLIRLRNFAEELGHIAALVDLSILVSDAEQESIEQFFQQFANLFSREIQNSKNFEKLSDETKQNIDKKIKDLESYWKKDELILVKCTYYFEGIFKYLNKLKCTTTLLIDGVESIGKKNVEEPFLNMLRYWHENKMKRLEENTGVVWSSIIIAYSTDLKKEFNSPLRNVGILVKLAEFKEDQISELAKYWGLDWSPIDFQILYLLNLVGGQPMLVNWFLCRICQDRIDIEELQRQIIENEAPPNDPISSFLIDILQILKNPNNKKLLDCLRQLMTKTTICEDEDAKYKLERAGLIKYKDNELQISCQLYNEYFKKYLLLD